MTRAWHFELGVEAGAYQRVEYLVLDLHSVDPPLPLARRLIGGEAFGTVEGLLKAGEHRRGQQNGLASWDVGRQ